LIIQFVNKQAKLYPPIACPQNIYDNHLLCCSFSVKFNQM
jgi:hypothetical protein